VHCRPTCLLRQPCATYATRKTATRRPDPWTWMPTPSENQVVISCRSHNPHYSMNSSQQPPYLWGRRAPWNTTHKDESLVDSDPPINTCMARSNLFPIPVRGHHVLLYFLASPCLGRSTEKQLVTKLLGCSQRVPTINSLQLTCFQSLIVFKIGLLKKVV
jgi:hypothetical protein